jgi:hypothetical protein
VRCKTAFLRPWPEGLGLLAPGRDLGDRCRILLWAQGSRTPVLETLMATARSDRTMKKHVARAVGAVLHFSTIDPARRVPAPWGVAPIGAADVEARTGLREKLWKFGVGGGTRVRTFAANVDDQEEAAIVLLGADVKSDDVDAWARVAAAIGLLREGGGP